MSDTIDKAELQRLKEYVDIIALAQELGAQGVRRDGRERFKTCCIFRAERTESLALYADQGSYHCFGCGAHGDAITMVMEMRELEFIDAVRWLAKWCGYWPEGLRDDDGKPRGRVVPAAKPKPRIKEDGRKVWNVVTPVPAKAQAPSLGIFEYRVPSIKKRVKPLAMWVYRDGSGQILGCDLRYEYAKDPRLVTKTGKRKLWGREVVVDLVDNEKGELHLAGGEIIANSMALCFAPGDTVLYQGTFGTVGHYEGDELLLEDGRVMPASECQRWVKDVVTWTWVRHIETGEEKWHPKAWPSPAPLYGLDRLAAMPDADVLVCEGCKASDAGQRKKPDMACVSWRGGTDSAKDFDKNRWHDLKGRRVWIWPDADDVGRKAAWYIADHLRRIVAASVRIVPTEHLPNGWDLADDLPEASA